MTYFKLLGAVILTVYFLGALTEGSLNPKVWDETTRQILSILAFWILLFGGIVCTLP